MENIEFVNDDSITLFQYINDNFIGLMLLALSIFIIYFVDYISQLNAVIFAIPPSIPGMPTTNNMPITNLNKAKKSKKR